MKMAKANENDLNAALEMCRALEALEGGYLPAEMTADDDGVAYYADEHAEKVVEHLVAISKRASLFRVCFGMTVLLDPQNKLVDPEASTLEAHPKFSRIAEQRYELLAALKGIQDMIGYEWLREEFNEARDAIAKAEAQS